ncbi:MAG TPA: asparagine synthase C-terminal domain-containing protein, partial [Candidatus Xenobia bacterium]
HLSDAVYHSEGLTINGQLVGRYLLYRAVRQAGYKVVLTGEGADEVFLGYAHLQRDFGGPQPDDPTQAGIMLPGPDAPALPQVQSRLGHVPSFLSAKVAMCQPLHALLDDDLRHALTQRDMVAELLDGFRLDVLRPLHAVEQSAWLWTRLALAGYILRTLSDGAEMASSVEGRPPFLDHHLYELARSLPVQSKMNKLALRDALKTVLPEPIRTRPKHPFLAPPITPHRVRDRLAAGVPFFNTKRVLAWLEAAPSDPALHLLLSIQAVQDRLLS